MFHALLMGILSPEFPIPTAAELNEKAEKERWVFNFLPQQITANFNHPFIHYSQGINCTTLKTEEYVDITINAPFSINTEYSLCFIKIS